MFKFLGQLASGVTAVLTAIAFILVFAVVGIFQLILFFIV